MSTDIAKYLTGDVPWHWHSDVEIFFMVSGSAQFSFGEDSCIFHAGEGGFINRHVLHSTELYECSSTEIITLIFSPSIFTGGKESSLYKKITAPIYSLSHFQYLKLTQDTEWQHSLISEILLAYQAYKHNETLPELAVIGHIARLWQLLVHNIPIVYKKMPHTVNLLRQKRLKLMMAFIHENYQDPVTLQDIANAAGISSRECSRIFQEQIGMAPGAYLVWHRTTIAASLLRVTDASITEIAVRTGFNNSSYFTRTFKKQIGMTPKAYQKQPVD